MIGPIRRAQNSPFAHSPIRLFAIRPFAHSPFAIHLFAIRPFAIRHSPIRPFTYSPIRHSPFAHSPFAIHPMSKQFLLVVYDISHDKRRTKLHNTLKDFGSPVQYSVFECLLDEAGLKRMKKAVNKVIKPRLDRVRYYPLCRQCLQGVEVTSGPELLAEQEAMVV
jgi:CRISPR-associated protein Cas2